MIRLLLYALLLIAGVVFAANDTPSLVPRGDGQGSIGSADAYWSTGSFKRVFVSGNENAAVPVGVNQGEYLIWNGTNWTSGQLTNILSPSIKVGTNVLIWNTTWPTTNIWTNTVSTQLVFNLWGGGGVSASGAGALECYWRGPTGTVFEIVLASTNNSYQANSTTVGPGSGRGLAKAPTSLTNANRGGGYSSIRIYGDTTNFFMVAGGSGGNSSTPAGSPGGALVSTLGRSTSTAPTLSSSGYNATADDAFGLNAAGGTNRTFFSDGGADGSFLQGGNYSTNGISSLQQGHLGGGGGGWYGGSAATVYSNIASNFGNASGGGGLNYINTNYIVYGLSFPGYIGAGGSPVLQDRPTYVSGVGVGGGSGGGIGGRGGAGVQW